MNARIRARTARVATHLGQPLPATRADLFGLLQVLGVVVADGFSWRFGSDIPHVVDVGFLTEIEAADEQAVRLRREHDAASQAIIGLFVAEAAAHLTPVPVSRWEGDLGELATRAGFDVDGVRSGLLALVRDGDFEVSPEVDGATHETSLVVTVDWSRFDSTRVRVRGD